MRLIDADELKELILKERDAIPKTIVERYSFGVGLPNRHGDAMRGGIRKALRCMEQCTTIEAEPVKHGRWVWDNRFHDYTCSECHNWDLKTPNFCSNCGAKMDEVQHAEDVH